MISIVELLSSLYISQLATRGTRSEEDAILELFTELLVLHITLYKCPFLIQHRRQQCQRAFRQSVAGCHDAGKD